MCVVLLLAVTMPVMAEMTTDFHVQLVYVTGTGIKVQHSDDYQTLENAVKNAASGSIIEVYDDITVSSPIVIPADTELLIVSGTKREKNAIFGASGFVDTDKNATTRTVKKNFDGSLFTLGENSKVTFENIVLDGNGKGGTKGGLIYAENGATLLLTKGECKSGVTLKNAKLGDNSFGGAIYAEKNAVVKIENAIFSGNTATVGKDIYAEQKSDVTIASGISADFGFPEETGVDISGLNLILTGEIGLTFHTVVPDDDKYLGGTFVMTSRTGEEVQLNIAECYKDSLGRYMAKYNVSSCELSEPITLTVYDKDGNPVATKEKSVEDYGKWLLESGDTTEAEKDVIRALLNYGHFAQIECSEYEGWEIGTDYAETAKYADLTTADSAFNEYTYTWTGYDSEIHKIGVQLDLDYKTDVLLHFPTAEKPTVLINDEAAEVEESPIEEYNYLIRIEDISALDLAKEFAVKVNDKITLTLSAMSYCKLAIEQGSENCKNAVKALYEFYQATVKHNEC